MLLTLDGEMRPVRRRRRETGRFSFQLGRRKKRRNTAHPLTDTALNLVSMSVGPLSSLLSDEYHLQTKSKQRSLQGFVEEVQIVNADF